MPTLKFKIQDIEALQMDADNMAYQLLKAKKMMLIQSVCSFNLFWFADLSPMLLSERTVDFMLENIAKFKRKLTAKEFCSLDFLVKNFNISNFDEFTAAYKNYKPQIFNNLWECQ